MSTEWKAIQWSEKHKATLLVILWTNPKAHFQAKKKGGKGTEQYVRKAAITHDYVCAENL